MTELARNLLLPSVTAPQGCAEPDALFVLDEVSFSVPERRYISTAAE